MRQNSTRNEEFANTSCFISAVGSAFSRLFIATIVVGGLARSYTIAEQLSIQLANPCEFPSPDQLHFSRLCQFDYHQTPYLCDPSGMMSRTETEILDRHIRRLTSGHNATGCICPPPKMSRQFLFSKKMLLPSNQIRLRNASSADRNLELCEEFSKIRTNAIRVNVVLVPYSNMESVNLCLRQQNFLTDVRQHLLHEVHDFVSSSLAYAQQLLMRWVNAPSTFHDAFRPHDRTPADETLCSKIDLFLVYIQHWMPNDVRKPYVARIFRNRLQEFKHLESAHRVSANASPFETVLHELTSAIRLTDNKKKKDKSAISEKFLVSYATGENLIVTDDQSNDKVPPLWAYFLCGSLLFIVMFALYIGNYVSKRVALTQLRKKSIARSNATLSPTGINTERNRQSFGLAISNAGASGAITSTPLGGALSLGANTKSSMMFRHFSSNDRRPRHGSERSGHIQKI